MHTAIREQTLEIDPEDPASYDDPKLLTLPVPALDGDNYGSFISLSTLRAHVSNYASAPGRARFPGQIGLVLLVSATRDTGFGERLTYPQGDASPVDRQHPCRSLPAGGEYEQHAGCVYRPEFQAGQQRGQRDGVHDLGRRRGFPQRVERSCAA